MQQLLLNILPQGAVVIRDGMVVAINGQLKCLPLPQMVVGQPLPQGLHPLVELKEESGTIPLGGIYLTFFKRQMGEELLLLLWREQFQPSQATMDGFFVRLRQELAVSGMGLEAFQGEDELASHVHLGEMKKAHYSAVRLLENMELLREERIAQGEITLELVGYCQRLAGESAPLLNRIKCKLSLVEKDYGIFVCGEEQLLQRLILGLVANCIQRGGRDVVLQLAKSKNRCKIAIWAEDGKEENDTASLFVTPDSLDITVVRQLTKLLHGSVLVGKTPQGGEKITLSLDMVEGGNLTLSAPELGAGERYSRLLLELCDVLPSSLFRARDLI